MKKIIPIVVVGMLVLSGLGAVAFSNEEDLMQEEISIAISTPTFEQNGEYVLVDFEESTSKLLKTGKPIIPVYVKTFSYKPGTKIDNVNVQIDWEEINLNHKIMPAIGLLPQTTEPTRYEDELGTIDEAVYSSAELYPAESYSVRTTAGLKNDEHVTYVNVRCNAQYSPANDYIKIPKNIKIEVKYDEPQTAFYTADEYDLLIITHDVFEEGLQPLVEHKNLYGMRTIMKTVDEIYDEYDGVADWEEIKLYIKDAMDMYGITYVLLAGGRRGQTEEWWVPDFRSHNWNPLDTYDPPYDETYSADLYFADVAYVDQYGFHVFDDWDTNNNGIYGEGPDLYQSGGSGAYDHPDLDPDVHLGRIPLRYTWEVPIVVDKIIEYETSSNPWFKKAILCGGDGFPTERYPGVADEGVYEGEIVCNVMADMLTPLGWDVTKAYCSEEGDVFVTEIADVTPLMTQGAGFVHMTGHASPFSLGSYYPNVLPIISFYNWFNLRQYDNGYKLPLVVAEGCHNSQFDVTTQDLVNTLLGDYKYPVSRSEWIPHDASSQMVIQPNGGAIAVIGNTALGLGGINNWCTGGVGGWIMIRFVHAYAVQGREYIGTIWSTGVTDYNHNFPVDNDMGDRKTVEERVLLGDPSIKFGGYHGVYSEPEEPTDNPVKTDEFFTVNVPSWQEGDSWTYRLDNIDFEISELEERSVDFAFSAGDITLEVTDVTSNTYMTEFSSDDIDVSIDMDFDFMVEDMDPVVIPDMSFQNISLTGKMTIDKATLGINKIEATFNVEIMENLGSLPIQLPPIINKLSFISIPANIDLTIEFDEPFTLFMNFPMENGDFWGFTEYGATITIDGKVESIWLRILSLVNRIIPIIPEEFAQYLPVIDISDILNDFGIPSEMEFNIPINLDHYKSTKFFRVDGQETVSTPGGTYNAAKITILDDNANVYYSNDAKNIVKMEGRVSEYCPIINDLNMELIK